MDIEFSKNGEGRIVLGTLNNMLYIGKITKGDVRIGELKKDEEIETELLARLIFHQTESIDSVIEELQKVKTEIIRLSAT